MDRKEKKELREVAENRIKKSRTGNPIADSITANKIWGDYLRTIGVSKR